MYRGKRRKKNKFKPIKSLKTLSKNKLLDAYKIEKNIVWVSSYFNFNYVVNAFHKIEKTLSEKVFLTHFGNEDDNFEKFLWFVLEFISNSKKDFRIKDYSVSISQNWAMTSTMSEISFVGCNYLKGKISLVLGRKPYGIPRVKEVEINPKSFNNKFKLPFESSKNYHKQICLTVINQEWLYSLDEHNFYPLFFDMNSGTVFNFDKTTKFLSYPAFKIKAITYERIMTLACCDLIMKLEFKHFVCPDD